MFEDNDTYEDHFKTVHGISSKKTGPFYKCEECSKQFNHKSNYLVHTLIHSGMCSFIDFTINILQTLFILYNFYNMF